MYNFITGTWMTQLMARVTNVTRESVALPCERTVPMLGEKLCVDALRIMDRAATASAPRITSSDACLL
jgi:hypothetical protein